MFRKVALRAWLSKAHSSLVVSDQIGHFKPILSIHRSLRVNRLFLLNWSWNNGVWEWKMFNLLWQSVCSLPPLSAGGWTSYQILKKGEAEGGGLDRTLIFRGELVGKRGWHFGGNVGSWGEGCNFYMKKTKIWNI